MEYKNENKNCQNCKKDFTIESGDFSFYEKIKVPPPTFCPECRLQRRLAFFNERSLYKRNCDMCAKSIISIHRAESQNIVYCTNCWWSDGWDATQYGLDYDFTKPFFEQFFELKKKVPELGVHVMGTTMINSDYCNAASYLKDCYLLFNSDYSEESAYSTCLERSKNCFDIYMGDLSELCYESANIFKCNRVFFSTHNCRDCIDVWFSRNLRGCQNCFGCVGLRNKQYYIYNKPYSKEDYFAEIKKIDTGSYAECQNVIQKVDDLYLTIPVRYVEGVHNVGVVGDYVFNSKNVTHSFEVTDAVDCKYSHFLFLASTNDSYDFSMWGGGATRMYECMGTGGGQSDVRFSYNSWSSSINMDYAWNIQVSNGDLFGCVGLKNKKFCILNKQYTESEYKILKSKIIEQMNTLPFVDKKGRVYRYGEFFPSEISSFGYNETIAQCHIPLTKEECLEKGYNWFEKGQKEYQATISNGDIPDNIKDVGDSILNEILECAHQGTCSEQCSGAFKIISQELDFYRRMKLPLPKLCSNCRHYRRLRTRNPMKLWSRSCMCDKTNHIHEGHCQEKFETSYAPDRPEIVYCEKCYQQEVV
jgi:hypothetical protein